MELPAQIQKEKGDNLLQLAVGMKRRSLMLVNQPRFFGNMSLVHVCIISLKICTRKHAQ